MADSCAIEAARIAASAALLHGLAGIEAANNVGSVVATDILKELPQLVLATDSLALELDESTDNLPDDEA